MSKGRIKAVLFIIVFLLVIAVAVNLLMDMQSEKKAEATPTNDPYANTVTPSVDMQPALETPQPTPAISAVRRAYRDADARSAGADGHAYACTHRNPGTHPARYPARRGHRLGQLHF